jgi:hypothetical protein
MNTTVTRNKKVTARKPKITFAYSYQEFRQQTLKEGLEVLSTWLEWSLLDLNRIDKHAVRILAEQEALREFMCRLNQN